MILLALLACTSPPQPAGGLVSLSPQLTEVAGALGALSRLRGRSDYCDAPPEAAALPSYGTALTPALEPLAVARPEAILVDGSGGARGELLAGVAPVEVYPWLTPSEAAASTSRLAARLGVSGEALAARFAALDVPSPPTGPRVLLSLTGEGVADGEVWFIRPASLHGAALHAAGARNAVTEPLSGPPSLSLEGLLALDPDAVVVLSAVALDEAAEARIVVAWGALTPLRAAREGRVVVVDAPGALSVGPRLFDTVEALRRAVGPWRE